MIEDHTARLFTVQRQLTEDFSDAVLVESWSNDTWMKDDLVLRVCWRGDRDRLRRESEVLKVVPSSIPHAEVVGVGGDDELSWMVLHRLAGSRLDVLWASLPPSERRNAVIALAGALRTLHELNPPAALRERLASVFATAPSTHGIAVGTCVVPVPRERIVPLLERLEELPGVGVKLADRTRGRVDELTTVLSPDEFVHGVIVHGDAHFANVLWHEGRMTALLDFEWARIGPPDLEFEAACREDPYIEANCVSGPLRSSDVPLLRWMKEGYPELFERADLTERLWLYEISHHVRRLCGEGSTAVTREQRTRLERLVASPRVRFTSSA